MGDIEANFIRGKRVNAGQRLVEQQLKAALPSTCDNGDHARKSTGLNVVKAQPIFLEEREDAAVQNVRGVVLIGGHSPAAHHSAFTIK